MSSPDPVPPSADAPTDEPREAQVVRAFLASLELLDVERAASYLAPGVAYTNVSLPTIHGREAVRRALGAFGRVASGFEAENHSLVADGRVVLTQRTDVIEIGRLRIAFWVWGRFEVEDDRIVVWRDFFDWANVTGGVLRGLAGVVVPGLRGGPAWR